MYVYVYVIKCPSLKHGAFPQTFSCQRNTKALTLHQLFSLPELAPCQAPALYQTILRVAGKYKDFL